MSSKNASIQPLPPDVVAQIKSSISITHLNGVILELLKNALDANAQRVSVNVNFERGGCVVEDDGRGIPSAEFEAGGGLGKTHRNYTIGLASDKIFINFRLQIRRNGVALKKCTAREACSLPPWLRYLY